MTKGGDICRLIRCFGYEEPSVLSLPSVLRLERALYRCQGIVRVCLCVYRCQGTIRVCVSVCIDSRGLYVCVNMIVYTELLFLYDSIMIRVNK